MLRTVLLGGMLVAVAACERSGRATIAAEWTSADTAIGNGRMRVPATARWCPGTGRLAMVGIRGDSGIGILIRTDAIRPGEVGVVDTMASRSPSAVIALRFARRTRLIHLSSDSGTLRLVQPPGAPLTGTWSAWFSEPGTRTPVEARGTLDAIEPSRDTTTCAAVEPADSVVS